MKKTTALSKWRSMWCLRMEDPAHAAWPELEFSGSNQNLYGVFHQAERWTLKFIRRAKDSLDNPEEKLGHMPSRNLRLILNHGK
jgi:hypothetical protein